jgi:hypothetical protein
MAAQTDPTGASLLDRACILGVSEYGEGYKHSVRELPAVLAGRAGGRLNDHVHARLEGGNYARFHLTALRAIGLDLPTWGFSGAETSEDVPGFLA